MSDILYIIILKIVILKSRSSSLITINLSVGMQCQSNPMHDSYSRLESSQFNGGIHHLDVPSKVTVKSKSINAIYYSNPILRVFGKL